MIASREAVKKAVEECLVNGKGKKKFVQSIDLAINFRDVDFKKPENRLSVDVTLPNAAKQEKVAVFADGSLAFEARKHADLVISGEEIGSYAGDKKKQKELLDYALLASPQLMAVIGKQLGQLLAPRGRLPKPIAPNADLKEFVEKARKSISLKSKGKYLPALHCIVGRESMSAEEIAENVLAVLEAIEKSIEAINVKSLLIKTTMGKPVKIM